MKSGPSEHTSRPGQQLIENLFQRGRTVISASGVSIIVVVAVVVVISGRQGRPLVDQVRMLTKPLVRLCQTGIGMSFDRLDDVLFSANSHVARLCECVCETKEETHGHVIRTMSQVISSLARKAEKIPSARPHEHEGNYESIRHPLMTSSYSRLLVFYYI